MTDRTSICAMGAVLFVCLVVLAFFAWPNYGRAAQIHDEIDRLHNRIDRLSEETEEVQALAQQLDERKQIVGRDLREIPPTPEIEKLIRQLSLRIDGYRVVDQTFNTGQESTFERVSDGTIGVLPLTVGMIADFDSIFALLRATESNQRLIRLVSVRMERDPEYENLLTTTIGVEAVFSQPPLSEAD